MRKLMIVLIALIGIGLMGALILMSSFGGFGFNSVFLYEKKVLKNDKIDQIEVTHTSTDVNIIPTKDQNMTVELNGKVNKRVKDQYKLEVKEDGEKVNIAVFRDDNEWFSGFNLNSGNVDLNLKLPEKLYESIDINLSSGDMNLNEIQAKEVTLNTSSGDINVEKSEVEKKLSINSQSGDLMLQNLKAESLHVDLASGDSNIKHAETKSVVLSSKSGNVGMNDVKGEMEVAVSSGDTKIVNKEMNSNIKIESTSGDVDIHFQKQPQSLNLNYKGTSGDGTVQLDGILYEEKSDHTLKGKIGKGEMKLEVTTTSGDFNIR
jgi:lia operon protein LiaG